MRRWLTEQLYLLYSFTLILFISNMFIHSDTLSYIVGTLAMVMIILSFSGASTLYRVLGIVFVTVGAVLFIYSDLPITHVPYHLTSTMPLLAFFTVLPWMNSAVRAGRFDRKINELMKVNIGNLGSLYVRSSFTTYILCMFINLSALLVSQEVLQKSITNIQKRLQHSFINKATLRSFVFALTWSPTEIMVAISIDATGISYLLILPWLLLISIIGLAVDLWRGHRQFKGILYESSEGKSGHLPKGPMVLQI